MSVSIQGLTKVYGAQTAVDHLTFEVKKGQVLGFLGPNGAGKSTTMKMICGYIPPSEGDAEVCGFSAKNDSLEVRRRIGYLPEHNPLYKDMYVREYLGFFARLHGLPNKKSRIEELIELTGLQLEQSKPISALSKGYRQRVGLAQAMLHDPEVLILDEPTSGLDPNQLVEIRRLIQDLGKEKTVIFSTHILQEVQAICDRVIIINRGKLVADDPIDLLQQRIANEQLVTVEIQGQVQASDLKTVAGVSKVTSLGKNRWQISSPANVDIRPGIFQLAVSKQWILLEMHRETLSVEEVFKALTGKSSLEN